MRHPYDDDDAARYIDIFSRYETTNKRYTMGTNEQTTWASPHIGARDQWMMARDTSERTSQQISAWMQGTLQRRTLEGGLQYLQDMVTIAAEFTGQAVRFLPTHHPLATEVNVYAATVGGMGASVQENVSILWMEPDRWVGHDNTRLHNEMLRVNQMISHHDALITCYTLVQEMVAHTVAIQEGVRRICEPSPNATCGLTGKYRGELCAGLRYRMCNILAHAATLVHVTYDERGVGRITVEDATHEEV